MTRTGRQTSPRPLKMVRRRSSYAGDHEPRAVDTRTNQELADLVSAHIGTGEVSLWDLCTALKATNRRLRPVVAAMVKTKRLKAIGPTWRRRYARAGYQERPRERRDLAMPTVQAPPAPSGGSWWVNRSREEFAEAARHAQPTMRTRLILARRVSHDGIGVWPQS